MNKKYNNSGIILFDILIAISLAIIFITIMTSISIDSQKLFEYAKERSFLLDAYESGESVTVNRLYGNDMVQKDFEIISTSSMPNSNFSSSSNFRNIWNTLEFTHVLARPSSNLTKSIGTPLCSVDFLSKDADSTNIVPITIPVNPLLPLTDLEVRNGIAYISTDSSTASDPDLLIVDIRNTDSPVILSSINTGPGITSIALVGKRIYVAVPSTVAELHIIRLDGLMNLILEEKFKLPLPYATATPPLASSIFYSNSNIYLGTEKWDGEELNIIDVSNPLQPVKISGFEIGSKVQDIFIHDNLAYIASGNQGQLITVDISDSVNPIITNIFSPSGWSRQEGKASSVFENIFNFGRNSGGYNIASDHEVFTWQTNPFIGLSTSSSISIDSTSSTISTAPTSIDIPGGVYGITADRSNIYLATRQINKEFQIFDHSLTASSSKAYSLPIAPQMMTCDGNHLYILAHTAAVIYDITFN
ncbi:MAG: hypothetical protein WC666_04035 [Candidatus Paceibacterota bacterium]